MELDFGISWREFRAPVHRAASHIGSLQILKRGLFETPEMGDYLNSIILLATISAIFAVRLQGEVSSEFPINKEAVGQGVLIVPVRLGNGDESPFLVDTGSPVTLLDQSFKRKLGRRLNNVRIDMWGVAKEGGLYPAPKLYLGSVPLITWTNTATCDLADVSSKSGFSVRGVLGMDCLTNYCVQIDFAAGKMRFLDRARPTDENLGNSYPILLSNLGQDREGFFRLFIHHASLIGDNSTNVLVDTGLALDGAFDPEYLRQQEALHRTKDVISDSNQTRWHFSESVWDGQIFTNIVVTEATSDMVTNRANILGLRFLARHLLTLDFPNGVMYLQRQRVGAVSSETVDLIESLRADCELPEDVNARLSRILRFRHPPLWFRLFGGTLNFVKLGDDTTYHFTVRRYRGKANWTLKKAWRTDRNGRTIEAYTLP